MQRQPRGVISARPFERTAGLDLKEVVLAIAILVHPGADRIALISWLDLRRPGTAISEDAAVVVSASEQDVGGLRGDDVLLRLINHHARHAARHAERGRIVAEPTIGLIGHAV